MWKHPFKPKRKMFHMGYHMFSLWKKNHWAKMCMNKIKNERRRIQEWTAENSNSSQSREYQTKRHGNRICSMKSDKREPNELYREFEQLAFDAIQLQKDDQTKVFSELQIKLPNKPGNHTLKAKVAAGNTLPLRTFRRMFPNKVDSFEIATLWYNAKGAHGTNCLQRLNYNAHGSVCIQR